MAWANTPVLWYNSQLCYEAVKLAVAVDTTEKPESRSPADLLQKEAAKGITNLMLWQDLFKCESCQTLAAKI